MQIVKVIIIKALKAKTLWEIIKTKFKMRDILNPNKGSKNYQSKILFNYESIY